MNKTLQWKKRLYSLIKEQLIYSMYRLASHGAYHPLDKDDPKDFGQVPHP